MKILGPGALPHPTTVREDWIELSDGCQLYSRTLLPLTASGDPVPAVLEYLPYRLTDGTAFGDATHHPYFAGHGYASIRVDIRGTGNSDGILLDEYLPQEQLDGCEVIDWIAHQSWCSGSVGMFGKSWGGFNGLQIAARRPPALKAVISAYSTDDRYADDVHAIGGCLLALESLPWASYMLGINALPPDPEIVGERWREMWIERLGKTPFFLEEWTRHQRRDDFWRQGSICEDFSALKAAILLVGGWADGYTNAVGRGLAGLSAAGVPCRGLIGPWSHGWPETADPGPTIGFLQECVRWWDRWLKGVDNGAMDGPALRAWMQEYVRPATHQRLRPGRWVGEERWPSRHNETARRFAHAGGSLAIEPGARRHEVHVASAQLGADAGAWCPYGFATEFPPDQRGEDALSLCFTTAPLTERLEILGVPEVSLELLVDRPLALVAARLCDVAPDSSSLLVTRGLLNLTHRESHCEPRSMPVDQPTSVSLPLDITGHAFAEGHRIRLAISAGYWPFAWPSPEPVTLTLITGPGTSLELPIRSPSDDDAELGPFAEPETTAPPRGSVEHELTRRITRRLEQQLVETEIAGFERTRLEDSGLEFGERISRVFSLQEGDPLSARVEHTAEHFLARGAWRIRIHTRTSMSCTADAFLVTRELDAYQGEERVHAARSSVTIPRDFV
jgi:uncharacterized protein